MIVQMFFLISCGYGAYMILVDTTFKQFTDIVKKSNYKIILYGFGVIGKITAPFYLKESGLFANFQFFVDADENKQGTAMLPSGEIVDVYSPDKLHSINKNSIIVITASRYNGIVKWLQQQSSLEKIKVFILPEMLLKEKSIYGITDAEPEREGVIPALIHYCWFSRNPIPTTLQKYIDSWRRYCPDYKIIEWNEDNYDIHSNRFTEIAYKEKKWAFVSDYARFDILYRYGGFYFDTDVEIIRNIDDLRYRNAFLCTEKWGIINSGGGCGFIPKHNMIKKIIDTREKCCSEIDNGTITFEASGYYDTLPFLSMGFKPNDSLQNIGDVVIYPSEYFLPYNYLNGKTEITHNTYSIHHFAESWVSY